MSPLRNFFTNRRNILVITAFVLSSMLIGRLFMLQIVMGADFQDNYRLKVERQEVIDGTRGNIYDRNGNLLAYNKLANAVTIEDTGTYLNEAERNETINSQLYDVIGALEKNGDSVFIDFGIYMDALDNYVFKDEGTRLQRFRADIFGHSSIKDLKYNTKIKIAEDIASADEIMDYLCDRRYAISPEYEKSMRFKIATIRYRMGLNTYQKYISTIIASNVSAKSVAYVMENKYRYTGIDIEEKSIRVYENPECFANIIGYTGTISTEEYEELSKTDSSYTLNDIIGKSGIEQYMNRDLMGKKGYQTVYVDSLGNLLETAEVVDQESGNDVYLSIDKDLTIKAYNLLEEKIAAILNSKIINTKEYDPNNVRSRDDILVPIYDVYYALVENKVININKKDGLSDAESQVYSAFNVKFEEVIKNLEIMLFQKDPMPYDQLEKEYQDYSTFIVRKLKSDGIFDSSLIDNNDANQQLWMSEKMAVSKYLEYAIEKGWIGIDRFVETNEYVDTGEIYEKLVRYMLDRLKTDASLRIDVYRYAILQDRINIGALCAMLYDQGVLSPNEESRLALISGKKSTYDFMKEQINNLTITPGQLGLDPCSGSCVIMDPQNGDTLAVVTYPGYNNNRLANNLDAEYYSYLNANASTPLYNHATQEKTAPGSTFKMVSAAAGLGDGVVDTGTIITDLGKYTNVSNEPTCWIYPGSTHGDLTISEAIRDSCNYFFYEVGYRLAGGVNYNDKRGIDRITEYASLFGLSDKTGVEIEESEPSIATEYPVMAAIGQSNNNFTTISLARYVTAVANSGKVYNLTLLSKVVDKNGNTIREYHPTVKNEITEVNKQSFNAIKSGMRMVVEKLAAFKDFPVEVAGKTGTAQQSTSRPNHALFVGYAPYTEPKVSVACRISFGYTSQNAADLAKKILAEYLDVEDYVSNTNYTNNNAVTD